MAESPKRGDTKDTPSRQRVRLALCRQQADVGPHRQEYLKFANELRQFVLRFARPLLTMLQLSCNHYTRAQLPAHVAHWVLTRHINQSRKHRFLHERFGAALHDHLERYIGALLRSPAPTAAANDCSSAASHPVTETLPAECSAKTAIGDNCLKCPDGLYYMERARRFSPSAYFAQLCSVEQPERYKLFLWLSSEQMRAVRLSAQQQFGRSHPPDECAPPRCVFVARWVGERLTIAPAP